MSSQVNEALEYIKPEEKIYEAATDKNLLDWKSFLYDLIQSEGLNPWDIDLSVLTQKYIASLQQLKDVDFNVSGKFLTIAVFLLKTKTQELLERDIKGMDEKIASIQEVDNFEDSLDDLEGLDMHLSELEIKKKKKYQLKYRNPIARKRKVTIFDLIKTLEKTFQQSNRRRANFFQRKSAGYDGPIYEKKKKDLKQLIEELYEFVCDELKGKKGHVSFSSMVGGVDSKIEVLEKFIPLLHLHNHERLHLSQKGHFEDIEIRKVNKE